MFARTTLTTMLFALARATETQREGFDAALTANICQASFDPVADPKMNAVLGKIEQDIHDLSNTESAPAIPEDSLQIPASLLQEKDRRGVGLEQTLQGLDAVANNQQKLLQDTTSQLSDIQHHLDSLFTVHA